MRFVIARLLFKSLLAAATFIVCCYYAYHDQVGPTIFWAMWCNHSTNDAAAESALFRKRYRGEE